jgi:hypothetical protein
MPCVASLHFPAVGSMELCHQKQSDPLVTAWRCCYVEQQVLFGGGEGGCLLTAGHTVSDTSKTASQGALIASNLSTAGLLSEQ